MVSSYLSLYLFIVYYYLFLLRLFICYVMLCIYFYFDLLLLSYFNGFASFKVILLNLCPYTHFIDEEKHSIVLF